ncbi:hypothetical protein [Streptomyces sp. NRRL S-474]|uniref:hypothetical protein n=1 Tax=Streptomyces sp. NRRL S-474 TaxID=1463909 RepID=UPI003B639BE3
MASSSTIGTCPPSARDVTRSTPQWARARAARNSASTRSPVPAAMCASAPVAAMSRRPGQTAPSCPARASSATRNVSCRRASGRSVAANSTTPAARGGPTTSSSGGASVNSPASAPAAVNTKERDTMTRPAKVSRAISTCWVSPDREPESPVRTPRETTRSTSRSRNGSTSAATAAYTRAVP